MLVVQLLLPRFLVVEVVFFIHFLQSSQACPSSKINPKRDAKNLKMTCQVPIGRNQIREEPLFYNIDGQYLLPNRQNGSNFITIEDKATISCPSAKFSSLGNGKKDVMEILCSKDNKFKTSQEETSLHEFTDLSCSKSIIESIQGTIHILRKHLYRKKVKTQFDNLIFPQNCFCFSTLHFDEFFIL